MDRSRERNSRGRNVGWHRESVHGSTFDRGLPFRESESGRDYPGGRHRVEDEYSYIRGPYLSSGIEDPDRQGDAFDMTGGSRNPNQGGLDLGGGMDEDWDRELGLRDSFGPGSQDFDWESVRGPFTGKGPKGYKRSNEQIRSEICERLTMHGYIDATDIEVQVEDGEVILEGTVDSRQAKRLAEDVAESVVSVKDVHNRLRIRQEQESPQRSA